MATLVTLVDGSVPTAADFNTSLVNLNTEVRPVATGGTGAATLTSNGVVYGAGTSAVGVTAQGGTRTILTANAGAPAWSATPIVNTSLQVGVASTTTGSLILAHASSANTTTIQGGNATEANTYTWPADGGTAGQFLRTDGATPTTALTWVTGSTTPVTATVRKTSAFTTTSTSFVSVTDLTLTMTTGANRVLLIVTMVCSQSAAGNQGNFTFAVDATDQGDATNGLANERFDTASYTATVTYQYLTDALTAASHTFLVRARANAGTLTIEADSWDATFSAIEIA